MTRQELNNLSDKERKEARQDRIIAGILLVAAIEAIILLSLNIKL